MKIKINQFEEYVINLPENLTQKEFLGLLLRLNQIGKIVEKEASGFNEDMQEIPVPRIKRKNRGSSETITERTLLKENRAVFVELLSAYYTYENTPFWNVVKKYKLENLMQGKKAYMASNFVIRLRDEIHKVTPQECGLQEFLGRKASIQNLTFNKLKTQNANPSTQHKE